MGFDAREAAKRQGHLDDYDFVGMDGEGYTLPNLKGVQTALVERFQSGDMEALREIAGDDAYEAIAEMPNGVSAELVEDWARHSGMGGKAASPSSQRKTPGKQRKRT